LPSTSEQPAAGAATAAVTGADQAAIALEQVWLRFSLRYYRKRLTLRGTVLEGLSAALRRQGRQQVQDFWALRGVDLSVKKGEVVGIVGPNGAGKSTLLRVIAGIYGADRGKVQVRGSVATLLSFGAGFDPRLPGRENVYKNGVLLGLSRAQVDGRIEAIVEMSGLGDFMDAPVNTYSSGMRARLGFSVAVYANPDILLIDEVVAAGDERFRNRVGTIFDQFSHQRKTVVFVTHQVAQLSQYCTRGIWLEEGRVHMDGAPGEVGAAYVEASRAGR